MAAMLSSVTRDDLRFVHSVLSVQEANGNDQDLIYGMYHYFYCPPDGYNTLHWRRCKDYNGIDVLKYKFHKLCCCIFLRQRKRELEGSRADFEHLRVVTVLLHACMNCADLLTHIQTTSYRSRSGRVRTLLQILGDYLTDCEQDMRDNRRRARVFLEHD